ncbi:MAG: hypothetical protein CO093_00150 [Alphaproteobacteria bacterium CG_4_9_14_3_um_filter_47_13]|nr:MAG: hypothetical protein CO093_00150 [Alphaproteobacteria bacterium CG_4_9_14_3_um_filter_47_13]
METKRYRHLCESERYMIVIGLKADHSFRKIAGLLGRSASSISREFGRNKTDQGYDALLAHQKATAKRRKPRIVKKLNVHRHYQTPREVYMKEFKQYKANY